MIAHPREQWQEGGGTGNTTPDPLVTVFRPWVADRPEEGVS
jgi:hypothetical protein